MGSIVNSIVSNSKISILGIGGGGGKVIDYLIRKGLPKEDCIYIDTGEIALNRNSVKHK
jgi:cell division GTPase FtsZ